MKTYWTLTGFRLRLFLRLFFIICLVLPRGFKVEAALKSTEEEAV